MDLETQDIRWRDKLLHLDNKIAALYKVFDKYGASREFISAWSSMEAYVHLQNQDIGVLKYLLAETPTDEGGG